MNRQGHKAGIAVLAGSLLVLTSCGGDVSRAEGESRPSTPATQTEAAPALSEEGVAGVQWSSLITQQTQMVTDAQQSWDDATCSAVSAPEAVDCQAHLVAMWLTALAVQTAVDGAQDPMSPSYLGDVPTHLEDAVAATTDAASEANEAGEKVECPGEDCVSTASQFTRAWDRLRLVLAAWEPYP